MYGERYSYLRAYVVVWSYTFDTNIKWTIYKLQLARNVTFLTFESYKSYGMLCAFLMLLVYAIQKVQSLRLITNDGSILRQKSRIRRAYWTEEY